MKIAVIAWGSLVWDTERNNKKGFKISCWHPDGPALPIEFTRVSKDLRLTLVITPSSGSISTFWSLSGCNTLEEAMENLRNREGTVSKFVGAIKKGNPGITETEKSISVWLNRHMGIDAAIWTNLPPKNAKGKNKVMTLDEAVCYLRDLNGESLVNAKEYICNAPINTPYRERFIKDVFRC